MVRLLRLLSMVLTAVLVGASSAIYATQTLRPTGMLTLGPWEAVQSVSATSADPYAHAYLASSGQLPPGLAEGLRFVALTSSDGRPLVPGCTITLTGRVDLARLWTLTVTQPGGEALPTSAERPLTALHSQDVLYRADGSFDLTIGARPEGINFLALASDAPIGLVLHAYDGALTNSTEATQDALPRIAVGADGNGCPA